MVFHVLVNRELERIKLWLNFGVLDVKSFKTDEVKSIEVESASTAVVIVLRSSGHSGEQGVEFCFQRELNVLSLAVAKLVHDCAQEEYVRNNCLGVLHVSISRRLMVCPR
jgi:hypothetical protein